MGLAEKVRRTSPDHRRRSVAGYFHGHLGWWPREITAHGLRWPINLDIVKFRQCLSSCNMPTPIIDSQIFVKNDLHKPKCLWRRTKNWEAAPALGPPHRSLLAGGNPRPAGTCRSEEHTSELQS